MFRILFVCVVFVLIVGSTEAQAQTCQVAEPGWTNRVVKVGCDRVVSQQTPIHLRPYRPFHFYGNTVRRLYYRGRALPTRNDWQMSFRALTGR